MLADTVKSWKKEWKKEGIAQGRQEGLQEGRQEGVQAGRQAEAAKLFLLLLNTKFGDVSQELQEKIRQSSPEQIENWTKQVFQAETPDALLNS